MVSDQLQGLCSLIPYCSAAPATRKGRMSLPWLVLAASPGTRISCFGSPHANHLAALGPCFLIVKGETGSYHSARPGPFPDSGEMVTGRRGKTLPSWASESSVVIIVFRAKKALP